MQNSTNITRTPSPLLLAFSYEAFNLRIKGASNFNYLPYNITSAEVLPATSVTQTLDNTIQGLTTQTNVRNTCPLDK